MRSTPMLMLAALAALTLSLNDAADARRMGGGGNLGAQRSVTPQRATPSQPAQGNANPATPPAATPAAPQAPTAAGAPKTAPTAAPAAAPSGMSRWLGPIAGIAAGLGLAALLSHFGLSEGFGSLLLLALAVVAGFFLIRMFLGRRSGATAPMEYSGAGAATGSGPSAQAPVASASSTPVWRIPSRSELEGAPASGGASTPEFGAAHAVGGLPAGFDAAGFAREAKRQYIEIQRAYDVADRKALADVMTAEMAEHIGHELETRGIHHPTEIVNLDAEVLDVATEGTQHWVSVRFTGLVKEDGDPVPHTVDEVWNLSKPVSGGSGWLLAGISQLA